MSRKGNCFDNAAIESFFGTLKAEYFHLAAPNSIDALEAGVHDYIRYYNHERIKLGLQGLGPGGVPTEKHRLIGGIVTVQLPGVSLKLGRFMRDDMTCGARRSETRGKHSRPLRSLLDEPTPNQPVSGWPYLVRISFNLTLM